MNRELEIEHRLTKVEEACSLIPKMSAQLDDITAKQARFDGRWGTMVMVGTAIWAMFAVFKDDVINWFKGH